MAKKRPKKKAPPLSAESLTPRDENLRVRVTPSVEIGRTLAEVQRLSAERGLDAVIPQNSRGVEFIAWVEGRAPWYRPSRAELWLLRAELRQQQLPKGKAADRRDEPPTELPQAGLQRGVAARNRKFLEWYNASGSETYHSPKRICDRWAAMTKEQRTEICPASPLRITRDAVVQGIKRARVEAAKLKAKRDK